VEKPTLEDVKKAKERNLKELGPILTNLDWAKLGYGKKGKTV
jgi:hypothetical protein